MAIARPVTQGPRFHFFGYYDKTPWDRSGRYLLALETDFMDRRPGPDDAATVGMVDLQDGDRFIPLAATRAWNWQQGCMLQWVSAEEIVYNDRQNGQFAAVIQNVHSGAKRVLPRPVYGVSPDGRTAVTASFSRLFDVRPGYGYAGVPDPWQDDLCPEEDGVYALDLATGESRLLFSLAQVAALGPRRAGMETGKHRFNHLQFNTDGSRFAFLHRWSLLREGGRGPAWLTRLFTAAVDGGGLYCLSDHDMISHYDWRDSRFLLAWARRYEEGDHYYLFQDGSEETEVVGSGVLTVDGHCSYSPDRKWILTDTYPGPDGHRTLLLYDPARKRRVDIGRFHGPTPRDGEIRCDLHPRWSRDGRQVCIDSIHEGARQMYVIDLEEVLS